MDIVIGFNKDTDTYVSLDLMEKNMTYYNDSQSGHFKKFCMIIFFVKFQGFNVYSQNVNLMLFIACV